MSSIVTWAKWFCFCVESNFYQTLTAQKTRTIGIVIKLVIVHTIFIVDDHDMKWNINFGGLLHLYLTVLQLKNLSTLVLLPHFGCLSKWYKHILSLWLQHLLSKLYLIMCKGWKVAPFTVYNEEKENLLETLNTSHIYLSQK